MSEHPPWDAGPDDPANRLLLLLLGVLVGLIVLWGIDVYAAYWQAIVGGTP